MAIWGASKHNAAEVVLNGHPGMIPTSKIQEQVWHNWGNYTTTGTNSVTIAYSNEWIRSQDRIWTDWNQLPITTGGYTTGTITYNAAFAGRQDYVWTEWQSMDHTTIQVYHEMVMPEPLSQAELDARQARRERESRERLAKALEIKNERIAAEERGMELLRMIMTHEEKTLFEIAGMIHVRGSEGGLYEIDTNYGGVHGNVVQVDEHGCQLARICVQPQMYHDNNALPLSDGYVGQYLAIKHDEATLRATGNFSQRRQCEQPNVPIIGQRAA